MATAYCQFEAAACRDSVDEWFEMAVSDAKSSVVLARREATSRQALFMAQQSMEAVTKALAAGLEWKYEDIRGMSHNNLNGLLSVVGEMISATLLGEHVDTLLSATMPFGADFQATAHLHKMIQVTKLPKKAGNRAKEAKKFFEDMLAATPEAVRIALVCLDEFERPVWKLRSMLIGLPTLRFERSAFLPMSVGEEDELVGAVVAELCSKVVSRLQPQFAVDTDSVGELALPLVKSLIGNHAGSDLRRSLESAGWKYQIGKEDIVRTIDVPVGLVRVLILGALVWPHESFLRYPAPPGAATDYKEAGRQVVDGKRQLGSNHYSSGVGAIACIGDISRGASKTVGLLWKAHKAGYLFPGRQLGTPCRPQ